MGVGENIKKLREEAGYTQKQLAGIMGMKPSYLSALERGQRRPGKKILPLLCDALGVDEQAIRFGPEGRPLRHEEKVLLAAVQGFSTRLLLLVIEFAMKLRASGGPLYLAQPRAARVR
ncbi:helix-turn-helix transcriptional regulator [Geobacter sp. FeAm09]|uniref:helix-turn-helix domain-containing protein n=1 Tax=Geobacter sp. FeAm09 TaxID=2597769 RepID=UPI0011EC1507|nr:helix-turn-helix transcriptional regulator [Geobacter sp. FeAm09]QEM67529.1 helix-turn-helix transcriptional regulator [Geobacter sp. FeAm09]